MIDEFKNIKGKLIGDIPLRPAVVGFIVQNGKILLGRRITAETNLGLGLYAGISGKVGDIKGLEHETPDEALVREFQEEVEIVPTQFVKVGQLSFMFKNKPVDFVWNQRVSVYLVTKYKGTPSRTDSIVPYWFSVTSIPYDNMWPDNRIWLPLLLEGKKFIADFICIDSSTIEEFWVKVV